MRRTSLRLNSWQNRGALLAFLLAWPASAPAAEITVSAAAAKPPAEAPALEMKDNAVQLSLDQAVAVALQQNLGLVIERYTRTQQRLGITQSLGIYDLLASVTGSASDSQSPTLSTIEASQSNQQQLNFSFRQTIPTGGAVSLGWSSSRSESNSPVLETPTFFDSGFTFAYTQPLLRDLGRLATERGILVAQTNSRISRQQFELQVISTVQQVVDAYWNLVGAREQLVVAQQSLDLAKELHERNKIQVEVGTMAPLELTQSQAAIASREEGIIRATSAVGDAEDQLRLLLNLPGGDLWQKAIVPTTPPETEALSTIDVNAAIGTALAGRPELRTNELQLAQARLDAEYFHNQLKPSLNLTVNYGYSGIGLNFNDALSQVTGLDFRGWFAQLVYAYPIQNRSARAQSAIANLDVDRVQTVVDQEKATIATEVRRASRAVVTAAKQIDAARVSREFQEQNLDAERKRYENGMSTSFQITQIQDQVTQARSDEVTAKITYRTALAEYYRVIGQLLDKQGVAVDDPETPAYAAGRFSYRRPPLPGGK
jgi:outer membrane protein